MGERARKTIEYTVGGLLGLGLGVGLTVLGMRALEAVGADPITFVIVLATAASGFAYGCIQVGIAAVQVVSLYARARRHLRARRWEQLAPLVQQMLRYDAWYPGADHPRTVARRQALIFVLVRLERFEEAAAAADLNVWSLSRRLGATHPDTGQARELAQGLREAARDPAVAADVRRAMRAADRIRP